MDRRINESVMYDVAARALLGVTVILWATAGIIDQWVDMETKQVDLVYHPDSSLEKTETSMRTEHFGIFLSELKGALSGKSNWTIVYNDCENGLDIGVYKGARLRGTSSGCQTTCVNKKWLYWTSLAVAVLAFVGSGKMKMGYLRGRDDFFPRVTAFVLLLFVVGASWYLYGVISTGMATAVDGEFPALINGDYLPNDAVNVSYPADFGICDYKIDETFKTNLDSASGSTSYLEQANDPEAGVSTTLWLSGAVMVTVATIMLLFDKTHGEDSRTIYSPLGEHLMR